MFYPTTLSFKDKCKPLILVSIVPIIFIFAGLAITSPPTNDLLSFGDKQIFKIVMGISMVPYMLCALLIYGLKARGDLITLVIGMFFIIILCSLTVVMTFYMIYNSPYVEECYALGSVGNIKLSECMDVVEMNPSYTGQEIINSVKSTKTVEKITALDILDRPLKPYP